MKLSKAIIVLIAFILVTMACTLTGGGEPDPWPTMPPSTTATAVSPSITPSYTSSIPSSTETPTETPPAPTSEPTRLKTPTSTGTVEPPTPTPDAWLPDSLPNLLTNPGFEEGFRRPYLPFFPEIEVANGWDDFFCDEPHTPEKCKNEEGFDMGRPEYTAGRPLPGPYDGNGYQQWFCQFRACNAGIYQVVDTIPGQTCEVGAYVRSWQNDDGDAESDFPNPDSYEGSLWYIAVNLDGDTFAFSDENLPDPVLHPDNLSSGLFVGNHYDNWLLIRYTFITNSNQTTVFFGNLRRWRLPNQDSYIDNAYFRCLEE